ncbi:MAG: hypothetical protein ACOYXT_28930 [Bacteroidota bacterium]
MAAKKVSTGKTGVKSAKGTSWTEKLAAAKRPHIKKLEKDFADMPAGSIILIATPGLIDEYVKQIPKGRSITLHQIRKDLATEFRAEYTCPLTTGIFLRIVAEAAHERFERGEPIQKITPFWRAINEDSPLAKKLSFGADFVKILRMKERIITPIKRKPKQ